MEETLITQDITLNEAKVIAIMRGATLCELCGETRGGAIGNGQLVCGKVICDYCHVDIMHKIEAAPSMTEEDAIRTFEFNKYR